MKVVCWEQLSWQNQILTMFSLWVWPLTCGLKLYKCTYRKREHGLAADIRTWTGLQLDASATGRVYASKRVCKYVCNIKAISLKILKLSCQNHSVDKYQFVTFSRAEHILPYSDVTIYIFAILYLSSMLYVYRFLWPLRFGWLLVCCLYKEVYLQIFKRVSFWLHGCCGEWEG